MKSAFGVGAFIFFWAFNGSGATADQIRGTFVTVERLSIPMPNAMYEVYTPIDDTLTPIWTDPRFF